MPKDEEDIAEVFEPDEESEPKDEEPKKKRGPYTCKTCLDNGVAPVNCVFENYGLFGKHLQTHKKAEKAVKIMKAKEAVKIMNKAKVEKAPEPPIVQREEEVAYPIDEEEQLNNILKNAGVVRRQSIIDTFMLWDDIDDLRYLDSLMRTAGVEGHARKIALMNWSAHRDIGSDYIEKKYGDLNTTAAEEKMDGEKVPAKKDPMDSMMEFMEKQMKFMSMSKMMKMWMSGDEEKEKEGKAVGKPRVLEDGTLLNMTDQDYNAMVMQQKAWEMKERLAGTKKEGEKIPIKYPGTDQIVNVPADQIDKYMMLMAQTNPKDDTKKDVYELVKQMEDQRREMEKSYQQMLDAQKTQNFNLQLEAYGKMIQEMRQQLSYRPDPIREMVDTREKLKEAGLTQDESVKSQEQHQMTINEKKLDTTMNMVLSQQASLNKKTDLMISIMSPVLADQAAKRAAQVEANLEKRKAQTVLPPANEQQMAQMVENLEGEPEEQPEEPPKKPRVIG